MTGQPILDQPAIDRRVFPAETLARMETLYPAQAGLLHHRLPEHRLLSLDALAALGESLPVGQVEYNPGDVPIGIAPEDVPSNGLSIGETIRTIDTNRSWAVLKNIESVPAYRDLLMNLLGELQSVVEPRTGSSMSVITPGGTGTCRGKRRIGAARSRCRSARETQSSCP